MFSVLHVTCNTEPRRGIFVPRLPSTTAFVTSSTEARQGEGLFIGDGSAYVHKTVFQCSV